jgi:hypothetical protein
MGTGVATLPTATLARSPLRELSSRSGVTASRGGYIDELAQISLNQDPSNASTGTATEKLCECRFFARPARHVPQVVRLLQYAHIFTPREPARGTP